MVYIQGAGVCWVLQEMPFSTCRFFSYELSHVIPSTTKCVAIFDITYVSSYNFY